VARIRVGNSSVGRSRAPAERGNWASPGAAPGGCDRCHGPLSPPWFLRSPFAPCSCMPMSVEILGRSAGVMVRPRCHRWHHSREPEVRNKTSPGCCPYGKCRSGPGTSPVTAFPTGWGQSIGSRRIFSDNSSRPFADHGSPLTVRSSRPRRKSKGHRQGARRRFRAVGVVLR
jgi:hypothetical protein